MSELEIVEAGDPILREPARRLSTEEILGAQIQGLIHDMRNAMQDVGGVGLAAPQMGSGVRVFIVEDPTTDPPIPFRVFINPELSFPTVEQSVAFEGCLSVPGFQAMVRRATTVVIEALDDKGRAFELEADGWHARSLQHELDHLDGTLFIDRMDSRTLTTRPNFDRYWRNDGLDDGNSDRAR